MRIHVLCNDGSPLGVSLKDLWGTGRRGIGIGGSEYALLTMCEQWNSEGHEVVLFNSPLDGKDNPFEQRNIDNFDTADDPDVLITFRSPNHKSIISRAKLKVWWSCDQFTIGDFKAFAPFMDKIVLISEYHQEYFANTYGITNTTVIDLPVRFQDFDDFKTVEKVKNRMIFNSVPDRGLQHLWTMWPIIKRDIPDATLHITSDYRLWGLPDSRVNDHRLQWMRYEGITYMGAIPRERLLFEQAEAELLLYPSKYDTAELFCVSVAEAQAMKIYPITSSWGALSTTNMGSVIQGDPTTSKFREEFITEVMSMSNDPTYLYDCAGLVSLHAYNRFHPKNISRLWSQKVFK